MLCSWSHWLAGRRQTGLVQVACRTWDRCRSLTPGSWPRAWCRWSQGSVLRDSSVMVRSGPGPGGAQRPGAVAAGRAVAADGGDSGGRLDREQVIGGGPADLRQLGRGERGELLVLFRLGRLILLADPVQPRLAFC